MIMKNSNYIFPSVFSNDSELREYYLENGFVSIKDAIPINYIYTTVSELNEIFLPYSTDKNDILNSAIIELNKNNKDKLYELHIKSNKLTSLSKIISELISYLRDILGKNIPIFTIDCSLLLGIPMDNRLVYNFHQESNYMKDFDNIFNIHFPMLQTSNIENGTMSILPKSHKLGTIDYMKFRKSDDSYTDLIPSRIEEITKSHTEYFNFLEVGDVVIFHKDLIHKSNFNSTEKIRLVGIGRLTSEYNTEWERATPKTL